MIGKIVPLVEAGEKYDLSRHGDGMRFHEKFYGVVFLISLSRPHFWDQRFFF